MFLIYKSLSIRKMTSSYLKRHFFFDLQAGEFSLSLKAPNRIKHFRIKVENNQYEIGKRTFDSIHDLIDHYKLSPIFTTDSGEKLYLKAAFSKAISRSRNVFGQ